MTRDEIIRIYLQVSDELCGGREWCLTGVGEPMQRFVALVAAAEREACARVCDDLELPERYEGAWMAGWSDGTDDCAAAIRART